MGNYKLKCLDCGSEYKSDYRLKCDKDDSFLRAEYQITRLELKNVRGMGKFHDWLPIKNILTTDAAPITYQSEELAREAFRLAAAKLPIPTVFMTRQLGG